jgi:hypothetical protein
MVARLFQLMSYLAYGNCLTRPSFLPGSFRKDVIVNNLSLTPPPPDTVAVWITQWLVPADPACTSSSDACKKGGKNSFVYFESNPTSTPASYWSGQNAAQVLGGGITLTYPGTKQITASGACSFVLGTFGTITIDVPITDVSLDTGVNPFSANGLYSLTASTMTLNAAPESVPPNPGGVRIFTGPVGGRPF